ncbi:MAG TPA: hypothetical protein VF548_17330 [Allosphingosinicella sp.]|jgi:hypothetical protein
MRLALATLLATAPGAGLPPDRPEARQVAIFDGLRPYFQCFRAGLGPDAADARDGDAVASIRARGGEADKACDPALKAAMAKLRIVRPTPSALGGQTNLVRWRKFNALQQTYRSALLQEALEARSPARAFPQSGSPYAATEMLLPYFSCFETAFRRHPGAFSRDHSAIAAARKDSEARCASERTVLRRKAGLPTEDAAPYSPPGPHWRVQKFLSDFQDDIVTYQLELNDARPAPLPPPGPPDPRPPEHARH